MGEDVPEDDRAEILICDEADIVLPGPVVSEVGYWAETVSTPMEAKETTVASVASTTVLAMVVLPS